MIISPHTQLPGTVVGTRSCEMTLKQRHFLILFIAAILLAVLLGFLLGHFLSKKDDGCMDKATEDCSHGYDKSREVQLLSMLNKKKIENTSRYVHIIFSFYDS